MTEIKEYRMASSVEEAWELNQKKSNCIVAGNMWLRLCRKKIGTAIDMSDLGLDYVKEFDDRFEIGAMTTLRTLECHEGLNKYTQGTVKEALEAIVGVQFRNMATVGGSLHSLFGFSDVLTLFLCFNTTLEYYKEGIIPLKDYALRKVGSRDVLTKITVFKEDADFKYRALRNTATDFPVLAVATAYYRKDDKYIISVGARPMRAVRTELKRGEKFDPETEAEKLRESIPTGKNNRAGAEYRSHLLKILSQRNFEELETIHS